MLPSCYQEKPSAAVGLSTTKGRFFSSRSCRVRAAQWNSHLSEQREREPQHGAERRRPVPLKARLRRDVLET